MSNLIADTTEANQARDERRSGRLMTAANLAQILGYSASAIEMWLRDGMPCARPGSKGVPHRYDSAQVVQWLIRRECAKVRRVPVGGWSGSVAGARGEAGASGRDGLTGEEGKAGAAAGDGTGAENLLNYKERIGLAKAKEAEINFALLEGRVVEIEAVERVLGNMAMGLKTRLLTIPARLGQQLAGIGDEAEVRRVLDEEISGALGEISQMDAAAFLSESALELAGEGKE